MWLWIALGGAGLYFWAKHKPAATSTDSASPPANTNTNTPAPSVVIDKNGGQVYVPPANIDTDKLLKELMLSYARLDDPEMIKEGPLKGVVALTYVLSTPKLPPVTQESEALVFVKAGLMLDNPKAEPVVMIFEKKVLDEVYAGKRPDRINIGLAPSSLAVKVTPAGSPYVMVGMKPTV